MRRGETIAEWIARTDAQLARRKAAEHFVYRAFDEHGLLLYIGCSLNVEQRMATHRAESPWARFCHRLDVEGPFDGMDAGRAAERQAIDTEGAFFNATQADIQRTQANKNAAVRALREIGIYKPYFDGPTEEMREDSEVWLTYCDEGDAYESLRRELEQVLKAGAFPYLTVGDRVDNYLAARALAAQERAA